MQAMHSTALVGLSYVLSRITFIAYDKFLQVRMPVHEVTRRPMEPATSKDSPFTTALKVTTDPRICPSDHVVRPMFPSITVSRFRGPYPVVAAAAAALAVMDASLACRAMQRLLL